MTPPAPTPEEIRVEELALAALKHCQEKHGPENWLCYDCLCRLFWSHGQALATAHAQGREEGLEEAATAAEQWEPAWWITAEEAFVRQEIAAAIRALSRHS